MSKKAENKMLVKLTQGVNFINILCKAFTRKDSKGTQNTVKPSVFFTLWGSGTKAAR